MSDKKLLTPSGLMHKDLKMQELLTKRDDIGESYDRFYTYLESIAIQSEHLDEEVESYILGEIRALVGKLKGMGSFNRIKDNGVKTWFTSVMAFTDALVFMDFLFNSPTIAGALFNGQPYGHLTFTQVIETAGSRGIALTPSDKTYNVVKSILKAMDTADWLSRKESKCLKQIFEKRFAVVLANRQNAQANDIPVLNFNTAKPEVIRQQFDKLNKGH
jgi:hypothetical protein